MENATSLARMATECQTIGETKTKKETTIRLQEIHASTGNATSVQKQATGMLIDGLRKEKRKTMTSKTYSWDQHYVEKSNKITTKNILKMVR